MLFDHDPCRPADIGDPGRELISVGDRRRQTDKGRVRRGAENDLFPYAPAVGILEEVDLV